MNTNINSQQAMRHICAGILASVLATVGVTANAGDWPCYRGANRDGNSAESIVNWPPTLSWRASGLGLGFACPVVSSGHVYTVGWDESNGRDIVRCYDENAAGTNPAPLWTGYYPAGGGLLDGSWYTYRGTRSTPAIDGNRLYAFSADGVLSCLDTSSGSLLWTNAPPSVKPFYGHSGSPLVEGNLVIVTSGGRGKAIDKTTHAVVWGNDDNGTPANSSPIAVTIGSQRTVVTAGQVNISGIDPVSGNILWWYVWNDGMMADPIVSSNRLWVTAAFNASSRSVNLSGSGQQTSVAWYNGAIASAVNGAVLYNGYMYGVDYNGGTMKCWSFSDGSIKWTQTGFDNMTSVMIANDQLVAIMDTGDLVVIQATPTAYTEVHRMSLTSLLNNEHPDSTPTLANGKLYIRTREGSMAVFAVTGGPGYTGTPYKGVAAAIPGRVEAENFDDGGEGVAYHDTTPGNLVTWGPPCFRTNDVDIGPSHDNDGGWYVLSDTAGEWLKYTVNVLTSGTYSVQVRATANSDSGGNVHLEIDGTNVTGAIHVPNTGPDGTMTTAPVNIGHLSAGPHILKLCDDSPSMCIEWMEFVCTAVSGYPPTVSITSPASNTTYTAPASISITATAADSDGTVSKVEFFQGATKLGEATSSPYTYTWTNVPAGTYSLTAKATDNSSDTAVSAPVPVTVNGPPSAPTITSATTTNGRVGQAFSYQITAGGNPAATNYTATGLPPGLNVAASSGLISGVPETNGLFSATISAINSIGTGSATLTLTIAPPITYAATAYTNNVIPGLIQSETYDVGAEGVAYHDLTTGNTDNWTNRNDDVDIISWTGYTVIDAVPGEWLNYTVNVLTSGTYSVVMQRACGSDYGFHIHFELDGVVLSGDLNPGCSGGSAAVSSSAALPIGNLSAGQHVLRVCTDSGPAVLLDSMSFICTAVASNTAAAHGTPVTWLQQKGFTNNFDAAEQSDLDNDGLKAWEEYVAGTDPNNQQSVLGVTIQRTANGTVISFPSLSATESDYTGKTRYYTLESSTNIFNGVWQAVANYSNMPGTGTPVSYTNVSLSGCTFYRVRARLQ